MNNRFGWTDAANHNHGLRRNDKYYKFNDAHGVQPSGNGL
jgi:hypothetical protein